MAADEPAHRYWPCSGALSRTGVGRHDLGGLSAITLARHSMVMAKYLPGLAIACALPLTGKTVVVHQGQALQA